MTGPSPIEGTSPREIAALLTATVIVLERFDHARDESEPPFYRGEKGDWHAELCDYISPDCPTACDDPSEYLIEWKQQPYDAGTIPVSGSCEEHALTVDRRQVVRISTHPERSPRRG